MRLVQLQDPSLRRRVARVEDDKLRLIEGHDSVYALAMAALERGARTADVAAECLSDETIAYDEAYEDAGSWNLLPAFDHPADAAHCLVAGTGLTHLASAKNRDSMHSGKKPEELTDSMRMYQWGVEGGRPAKGEIGVPPEWFYKGSGAILRGHNDPLLVPSYAGDGGEEPELAGAYVVDWSGVPRRVGIAIGNEFSDHQMERKNYLYLAPSKLRSCAIGPELVLDPDFSQVRGRVRVLRGGRELWSQEVVSGEANMSHSLANLEHHHFKYAAHRCPGDVHIHFYGAGAFSFGAGIALEDGDVMEVAFERYGRALRNPIWFDRDADALVEVKPL